MLYTSEFETLMTIIKTTYLEQNGEKVIHIGDSGSKYYSLPFYYKG
jgi:hypothetical protein